MFLCRCYLKQEFTDCLAMHLAYIKSFMQNCSMLHFLELFAVINFVLINAVNYRLISRSGVVFLLLVHKALIKSQQIGELNYFKKRCGVEMISLNREMDYYKKYYSERSNCYPNS